MLAHGSAAIGIIQAVRDLDSIMLALSRERPVFHSEADFQHALAWCLQQHHPSAQIRLEYRLPIEGERSYADIWMREGGEVTCLELKYWKRKLEITVGGDAFVLSNQAAQDISRYDFVKDLVRVERVIAAGHAGAGAVIAITNDRGYWSESRAGTVDAAFRLHEGRALLGELDWAAHAGVGATATRQGILRLAREYRCHWQPYSDVGVSHGEFRYLLVGLP